jgi:hypothetical protein
MAATTVKVEVLDAQWGYSDVDPPLVLRSGVHEVSVKNQAMLRALAGAEAAGAIKVKADKDTRARMSNHVESDSESFAKQQAAMESGAWHVGNIDQVISDHENRIAVATYHVDEGRRGRNISEEAERALRANLEVLKRVRDVMRQGNSYEEAVMRVLNG